MAVDPKIKEAILSSVNEADQPEGLTRKLLSWFEAIASGNEDINDQQSAYRHLELLYDEVQIIDLGSLNERAETYNGEQSENSEDPY